MNARGIILIVGAAAAQTTGALSGEAAAAATGDIPDSQVVPTAIDKAAVLDLGTPHGVDNVDAYRLMSESFAWTK